MQQYYQRQMTTYWVHAAFALNSVSLLFNLLSIFLPWISFTGETASQRVFNQLIPGTQNTGSVYLFQTVGCTKLIDGPSTAIQKSCTLIELSYLPDTVSYLYTASNVAISFMSISLPFNLLCLLFSYARAYNKGLVFYERMETFQRHPWAIRGLCIAVWICSVISFSSYSGVIGQKFNINTDGAILGFGGAQNRRWLYGGGFALCTLTAILSMMIVFVDLRAPRETGVLPPPAVATAIQKPYISPQANYRPYAGAAASGGAVVTANPFGASPGDSENRQV
jgi:hypothetical protein